MTEVKIVNCPKCGKSIWTYGKYNEVAGFKKAMVGADLNAAYQISCIDGAKCTCGYTFVDERPGVKKISGTVKECPHCKKTILPVSSLTAKGSFWGSISLIGALDNASKIKKMKCPCCNKDV